MQSIIARVGFTLQVKPVDHHALTLLDASGATVGAIVTIAAMSVDPVTFAPTNPGVYNVKVESFGLDGVVLASVVSDAITVTAVTTQFPVASSITVALSDTTPVKPIPV